ncbi:GGDEF domain-containing protein [Micromonospora endolithica]|uniref:GGDEF domain-containing protein n=2 Tax=Micromonospora endolithica TaxID=230091 RepID=A0A3A9ZMX6_9ACTN|nr:GGDEF domain-containing phosphodiesterase [Micromonospora endolithica]RKN49662.1 GGDEF domain-containing protein [Micromonospora endolithica]
MLLDAAVVVSGLTAAMLPLAAPPPGQGAVALVGLTGAAVLFTAGLLPRSRGVRPPARIQWRRYADAAAATVGLVLAAWLLLPVDGVDPNARLAAAVALGGTAVVALVALTGPDRDTGAARCRGGAALTLFGLVLLATSTAGTTPGRVLLVAVPPLVGGMLLTASGARSGLRADAAPARRRTRVLPRVLVPAVAVLVAVGRHLATGAVVDRTTLLIALAVVPALVVRELVRVGDRPVVRDSGDAPPSGTGGPRPGGPDRADTAPVDRCATGDGRPVDRAELLRVLAAARHAAPPAGALLMVDLHGADSFDHRRQDDVVAELVHRVRAVVGPRDVVAEPTGAGLLVVTGSGPVLAYALGTRLVAALSQPYQVAGAVLRLQVSIGLAEVAGVAPEDVLRQAGLARRRAVQLGRDRVEWYDAYLEEQLVRRLDLERELPGAVARGELDLVYQPVIGLADRQPVGTEALLRWRSPVLGTVLPGELLPVAEDLGILGELGCWVLDRACRQLAAWSGAGREDLWMAVNVTVRELTAPDFVPRTAAVLDAFGVAPERLVVEVPEPRVAAELPTVVARLAGLRSLGIRTALDDFRAEHASLTQLRRLPIDLLKVGPQVVDPGLDPQRPLIDVVVNVGDRLGLEIVAEELEWPDQVDGAYRAGCRFGQGFALARPATAERVEAYFEEFPTTSR